MPHGHRGVFLRRKYAKWRSVEAGRGQIRREPRISPTTGKPYLTELPIYERRLSVVREEVLKLDFLPPLRVNTAQQLSKEIASRVKWQIERFVKGGRR